MYEHFIPYSLLALVARVLTGLIFFKSFLTKVDLATWSIKGSTYFLFEHEYKFRLFDYLGLAKRDFDFPSPGTMAAVATVFEGVFPLLLWAGLGTQVAATFLLAQTCVIEMVYPDAYMDHGLWAIALLMLMRFGPGILSADELISWLGRRQHEAVVSESPSQASI
jgi:putative oxidoreductase